MHRKGNFCFLLKPLIYSFFFLFCIKSLLNHVKIGTGGTVHSSPFSLELAHAEEEVSKGGSREREAESRNLGSLDWYCGWETQNKTLNKQVLHSVIWLQWTHIVFCGCEKQKSNRSPVMSYKPFKDLVQFHLCHFTRTIWEFSEQFKIIKQIASVRVHLVYKEWCTYCSMKNTVNHVQNKNNHVS